MRPTLENQAAKSHSGASVRRIDHINLLAADVRASRQYMQQYLGCRLTGQIVSTTACEKGSWLTVCNGWPTTSLSPRITTARMAGSTTSPTRWTAARRCYAKQICLDNGVYIETGPHKHAIQQTFFLYMSKPAAITSKLPTPGAAAAPTGSRHPEQGRARKNGPAWGLQTIASFHTHGTPPVRA